jgi:hypothetical protein
MPRSPSRCPLAVTRDAENNSETTARTPPGRPSASSYGRKEHPSRLMTPPDPESAGGPPSPQEAATASEPANGPSRSRTPSHGRRRDHCQWPAGRRAAAAAAAAARSRIPAGPASGFLPMPDNMGRYQTSGAPYPCILILYPKSGLTSKTPDIGHYPELHKRHRATDSGVPVPVRHPDTGSDPCFRTSGPGSESSDPSHPIRVIRSESSVFLASRLMILFPAGPGCPGPPPAACSIMMSLGQPPQRRWTAMAGCARQPAIAVQRR